MHENRETSAPAGRDERTSPTGEGRSQTARMNDVEESDRSILPVNQPNNAERSAAEAEEGRERIKENTSPSHTLSTQRGTGVSQGLRGVRQAARERKREKFTALLHHLTVDLLRGSFYALKRQAAPGVDGVTWREYENGLEDRLTDLHSRVHGGAYRAQPSRRVYIPKTDGRQRPLGIASLEDKIVQQAVVTILNVIYEVDFKGFSYGFRPRRSPHQALDALNVGICRRRVNWILDADIRGFFDNMSHEWTEKFVQHRVADPRILRLIHKWQKAGVSEEGEWSETKVGTPQGAVISPLLANVYLHYVFDQWVDAWRKRLAKGEVIVVRYADDLVLGFERREDAERFLQEFGERLAKFGLELHPDKTRLIEFGRYAAANREKRGEGKPDTFDFLGFTHYCGAKKGRFVVWRKTAGKRMGAKLQQLKQELRRRMHEPLAQVGKWLGVAVRGYYQYHAVPGNSATLGRFRHRLFWLWWKVVGRRSERRMRWERYCSVFDRHVPYSRIVHPYPSVRFDAMHPR
jgi:RNA-directed DNA polymerase